MPSLVIDKPAKFERLVHVESLLYYDGELLGQYTLDGEHWLIAWTNQKDLGTHYWDRRVYFPITDDNLKKLLSNGLTLRAAMEQATEMWCEESKWERLPNGHGIPDTNVDTWSSFKWSQLPDDERPTENSFIRP